MTFRRALINFWGYALKSSIEGAAQLQPGRRKATGLPHIRRQSRITVFLILSHLYRA
jgi:hypothetical protein